MKIFSSTVIQPIHRMAKEQRMAGILDRYNNAPTSAIDRRVAVLKINDYLQSLEKNAANDVADNILSNMVNFLYLSSENTDANIQLLQKIDDAIKYSGKLSEVCIAFYTVLKNDTFINSSHISHEVAEILNNHCNYSMLSKLDNKTRDFLHKEIGGNSSVSMAIRALESVANIKLGRYRSIFDNTMMKYLRKEQIPISPGDNIIHVIKNFFNKCTLLEDYQKMDTISVGISKSLEQNLSNVDRDDYFEYFYRDIMACSYDLYFSLNSLIKIIDTIDKPRIHTDFANFLETLLEQRYHTEISMQNAIACIVDVASLSDEMLRLFLNVLNRRESINASGYQRISLADVIKYLVKSLGPDSKEQCLVVQRVARSDYNYIEKDYMRSSLNKSWSPATSEYDRTKSLFLPTLITDKMLMAAKFKVDLMEMCAGIKNDTMSPQYYIDSPNIKLTAQRITAAFPHFI